MPQLHKDSEQLTHPASRRLKSSKMWGQLLTVTLAAHLCFSLLLVLSATTGLAKPLFQIIALIPSICSTSVPMSRAPAHDPHNTRSKHRSDIQLPQVCGPLCGEGPAGPLRRRARGPLRRRATGPLRGRATTEKGRERVTSCGLWQLPFVLGAGCILGA